MTDSFSLSVDLDALAERIAARLPATGGQRGALTVQAAADYLSLSRTRIYSMIDSGELTPIRSGRAIRVPLTELDGWIARQLTEERGACHGETVRPINGRQTNGGVHRSSSSAAKGR